MRTTVPGVPFSHFLPNASTGVSICSSSDHGSTPWCHTTLHRHPSLYISTHVWHPLGLCIMDKHWLTAVYNFIHLPTTHIPTMCLVTKIFRDQELFIALLTASQLTLKRRLGSTFSFFPVLICFLLVCQVITAFGFSVSFFLHQTDQGSTGTDWHSSNFLLHRWIFLPVCLPLHWACPIYPAVWCPSTWRMFSPVGK